LKSWYNLSLSDSKNAIVGQLSPTVGILDWNNTKINTMENTYIVPVKISTQKKSFVFLVAKADNKGSFISGKYVYIITSEEQHKILESSVIDLTFLEGKPILDNFNGAIIENDF
jgi:hypothetical protein